ncbi:hypothetical protein [Halalkalicoccus sp. NIPERK01]|uniref:hypothetical protein n=1 Tax=Halalkalicoccus sp. NIPERK01 TaxID=3053469 RepID=UPI00256EF55D|nr:hypothetical protein [Halalkalicoccus sp. NIPERK01]MDL5363865.1 hypothetical protein [Halalkalicoccus sp. NIPERK01]
MQAFPIIPQTTIGKVFLGIILFAWFATALSVFGLVFNEPELIGPLPQSAFWHYLWYGVMHLVLIGTYIFLFKPWADTVDNTVIEPVQERESDEAEVIVGE